MSAIITPGLYNIPAEDYHADPCPEPSLSCSIAKILLDKSPKHAWMRHPRLNPDCHEDNDKKFDTGTAAHALLLQGEDVCVVLDYPDWRTNAAKGARDEAYASGRTPMLRKDYDAVRAMVDVARQAIAECSDLSGITLTDGQAERTIVWQEGGIWCRARLDWMSNKRDLILDYKTTGTSARPENWARTMAGMSGDIQPAFYQRGNAATGWPSRAHWAFLVQETSAPYACSFIGLSPAYLAWAAEKVEEAIRLWTACLAANDWPAYNANRIAYIEPPSWAQVEWAQRMADVADAAPGDLPWEQ